MVKLQEVVFATTQLVGGPMRKVGFVDIQLKAVGGCTRRTKIGQTLTAAF